MERITFGTYKLNGPSLKNAVEQAYSIGGVRNFDTAQIYQNEKHVS